MTLAQKIIKYLAIAFAFFLIITIISTMLSVLYALSNVLGLKNENEVSIGDSLKTNFENSDINELKIEMFYAHLTLKKGDTFKVETTQMGDSLAIDADNSNVNFNKDGQKLEIKEKKRNWFSNNNEEIIIYIPENMEFQKIDISGGAGKINIENLNVQKLEFELGAGEAKIENLNVSKNCNLENGAGKISILSGTINDLDLDMGIGKIEIFASLIGKNNIDAGVGNLNLNLKGNKEDYKIKVDKGIGNIKVNSERLSNNQLYGNGKNYIDIDGGIGNINVEFE